MPVPSIGEVAELGPANSNCRIQSMLAGLGDQPMRGSHRRNPFLATNPSEGW